MDKTAVSLIIRVRNERAALERLFKKLDEQDYAGEIELIVVDTESSDGSRELAAQKGALLVGLKQAEFTYPQSLNRGLERASHEVVVELVAHAVPMSREWLAAGVRHFDDPKVAGVWSPVLALASASEAEQTFYAAGYEIAVQQGAHESKIGAVGGFGATNVALRRSVWQEHRFDERFEAGGEDGEWAVWAIGHGYKIICDPAFAVRHSHGLDEEGLRLQEEYWSKLGKPRRFNDQELAGLRAVINAHKFTKDA